MFGWPGVKLNVFLISVVLSSFHLVSRPLSFTLLEWPLSAGGKEQPLINGGKLAPFQQVLVWRKVCVCVCVTHYLTLVATYLQNKCPSAKISMNTHDYRVKTCALVAIQDFKLHIVNFYRACKLSYFTVNVTFYFSIAARKRSKQNTDNSKLSRNIWSKKHVIMYRSYCNAIRGNSYTGLQLCNFLTGVYWGIIFWRK